MIEHMHTINSLHGELRDVRAKMMNSTETTIASERQLGHLELSIKHEQDGRRRTEQELAAARGASDGVVSQRAPRVRGGGRGSAAVASVRAHKDNSAADQCQHMKCLRARRHFACDAQRRRSARLRESANSKLRLRHHGTISLERRARMRPSRASSSLCSKSLPTCAAS